jgi:hypothetical protein
MSIDINRIVTPAQAGYAEIISPGNKTKEFDTLTCAHCNRVWPFRSTDKKIGDLGGWCSVCQQPICTPCTAHGCMPFEKKIALYEKQQR